ncbi:MAG: glycosyltransferase family 4 protein [Candidatus Marsarchaeota archaeon]|jgi:glycosyltransferase involved in cell wall biosynthesis|nr:glycosyltransferase family 4 protein [Candidatus Marsarchaeota archaeon]MCL5419133.1 glycosyltransferase family 4 protein [Candidatus Marsarchaeota archaeon]
MKIAFVSDAAYPWSIGGLEALEHTEAKILAKIHDVHFFSFRWPGMKESFQSNNIAYHTYHDITRDTFYRHGRRSIREAILFSIGAFRIFKYKFDVLQANEFPIIHIPILKLYCIIRRCKLVLDVAEVWDREYWTTYLGGILGNLAYIYANMALRMGDAYIANSSKTSILLERMGIAKSKIGIFSPVLDVLKLKRIKAKGAMQRRVIFSGRLIKEKAVDKWIRIMLKLNRMDKDFNAMIIGEGPEKQKLMGLARSNGLSKKIMFKDFYKGHEKHKLYKEIKLSKVFLHMSEREGLSIIILESIALGTPVVLPTYSPVPNEVKDMCIVEKEKNIPKKLAEMLHSNDKSSYLRNIENLSMFSINGTEKFYEKLFKKLNLYRRAQKS